MTELTAQPPYPVRLEVDYPAQQSRWKALLRLPLSIPIFIFAYLLQGGVAPAIWAAILVRGRIPRWLFDFEVALNRWQLRAVSYFLLLTDGYPPFEGDYAVRYEVPYPERSSRWRLVVWKFITSIPHLFLLAILTLTLVVVVPIGWFAILFTGSFPEGLHGYVVGILRWQARVEAYVLSLTDEFPPFSLSADAGAGGTNSYVFSSAIGVLAVGSVVGLFAALVILRAGDVVADVSYERLLAGELRPGETRVSVDSVTVELTSAADPADELVPFLVAQPGYRFVFLEVVIENERDSVMALRASDFWLKDDDGKGHDAYLVIIGGRIPPIGVVEDGLIDADLIFELPRGVDPAELRYDPEPFVLGTVVYEFR